MKASERIAERVRGALGLYNAAQYRESAEVITSLKATTDILMSMSDLAGLLEQLLEKGEK